MPSCRRDILLRHAPRENATLYAPICHDARRLRRRAICRRRQMPLPPRYPDAVFAFCADAAAPALRADTAPRDICAAAAMPPRHVYFILLMPTRLPATPPFDI